MMLAEYAASVPRKQPTTEFPQRVAALRKKKGLTQQLKRYEGGSSQPTLDVIRNLAKALGVSSDQLLFGESERGPGDDLKLQFEAVSRFNAEEKKVVRSLLEGMILKHEARRWSKDGG
jgi:transcriptional regulator with XRE-family HTH domain